MRFLGTKYAKNAFVARATPRTQLVKLAALDLRGQLIRGRESTCGEGRGWEREVGGRRGGDGRGG